MYVPRAHLRKGALKSDPTVILLFFTSFPAYIHIFNNCFSFTEEHILFCFTAMPMGGQPVSQQNQNPGGMAVSNPMMAGQAPPPQMAPGMHPGQHLPTHSQVQCTQFNTYLPTHRYSASRSTPTYPLTSTVHTGQHLPTHSQV